MPVIGFISSRSPDESASAVVAFRQGLAEAGYPRQPSLCCFRDIQGGASSSRFSAARSHGLSA